MASRRSSAAHAVRGDEDVDDQIVCGEARGRHEDHSKEDPPEIPAAERAGVVNCLPGRLRAQRPVEGLPMPLQDGEVVAETLQRSAPRSSRSMTTSWPAMKAHSNRSFAARVRNRRGGERVAVVAEAVLDRGRCRGEPAAAAG